VLREKTGPAKRNSTSGGSVPGAPTLADCTGHRTRTAAVRDKTKNKWRRCARLNRTENTRHRGDSAQRAKRRRRASGRSYGRRAREKNQTRDKQLGSSIGAESRRRSLREDPKRQQLEHTETKTENPNHTRRTPWQHARDGLLREVETLARGVKSLEAARCGRDSRPPNEKWAGPDCSREEPEN
jgi:hypothetical protein